MSYKTIFSIKPQKDNKKEFCKRIVDWLSSIDFIDNGYIFTDGKRLLNTIFKYSRFNNGYSNIDDLLNESNKPYANIFELCDIQNSSIDIEEVLVNIDIIVNSISGFKENSDRYFVSKDGALETIRIMEKAIDEFLLSNGYKLEYVKEKDQLFIVDNDIKINLDEIDDSKIKNDIIYYYDYRNARDVDEKQKIIVHLIGKLENYKNDISTIMGKNTADLLTNYANNFNLRHDNKSTNMKKNYNPKIAELSQKELLEWWDYIFTFAINIYMNLNKLKNVNINDGYK